LDAFRLTVFFGFPTAASPLAALPPYHQPARRRRTVGAAVLCQYLKRKLTKWNRVRPKVFNLQCADLHMIEGGGHEISRDQSPLLFGYRFCA
jgi:hypothetical protein